MDDESRRTASLKGWLPVLTLTLCAFIFNTSEFIPIGLLTDIGRDFGTSEAQTGWLVTAYAWVVAALSLPLMLAAAKTELKRLMLILLGLFFVSNALSGLAVSYWMLMASRIGVACAHSIFWSIVGPLAVEVAPARRRSAALSMVVVGSSIAMIVGLPMGRMLGLALGWRMTFLTIAAFAAFAFFCLAKLFPRVPSRNAVALADVPKLLTRPALLGIYILTPVMMTGNFTMYSYIEPYLAQVAGMAEGTITLTLAAYGIVGLLASWLFSHFFDRAPFAFMRASVIGIAATILLMGPASASEPAIIALAVAWGLFVTFYGLVFQSAVITAAPTGTAVAMSVYSGIFNVGIGSGALVGGLVCTHLTIADISAAGGGISAAAAVFCLAFVVPVFKKLRDEQRRAKEAPED